MHRTAAVCVWAPLTAMLIVAAAGCRACNDDSAYTPFGVASEMPTPSDTAPLAAPSGSAEFAGKKDLLAPPNARTWRIGDLDATLPAGRVFERALASDFDGDGKQDAVAWTVPAAATAGASSGELVYFPAGGASRTLQTLPGFLPTGPGCKTNVELRQTGAHTLVLDAGSNCLGTTLQSRTTVRALFVVAPAQPRPTLVSLRVADPAPGETLDLNVDSSDRDADGRDDVLLRVTIGKQGTVPAVAGFVWLDRAAGPARDALEPRKSFETAASALVTRAKNKKTRGDVATGVANMRRLFFGLCAESATARIFDSEGEPIRCGDLGTAFDRLVEAEVEASLGTGDALGALAALTRADWYRGAISKTARDRLTQRISKAVAPVDIAEAPTVKAAVAPRSGAPRLSPLSFEPDGTLLIESAGTIVRLSADGHTETVEPPAPPAAGGQGSSSTTPSVVRNWPLEVRSPSGAQWIGTTLSCDRSEVSLSFADPKGGVGQQPTDVLAPRPGACGARAAAPSISTSPVGWHGTDLLAVMGGGLVGGARPNFAAPESLSARGTALSPDGHWLVAVTSSGLVVTGSKTELWRLEKVLGSADVRDLGDCVVANDARAVACVQGRTVRFFPRP